VTAKISNLLLDYKIQVTTIKYKIDQITDRVRATHTHTQEILYYRDCDTRLKNSTCVNVCQRRAQNRYSSFITVAF